MNRYTYTKIYLLKYNWYRVIKGEDDYNIEYRYYKGIYNIYLVWGGFVDHILLRNNFWTIWPVTLLSGQPA